MKADEPTTEMVHYLLAELAEMIAKRERYRAALEQIAGLSHKPTAGLRNACAIARAALDGEA